MGAGSAAAVLTDAARSGDLGTLARMMSARAGTPGFYEPEFVLTVADALSEASAAGESDSVRLLLQCGAAPNARDQGGATALMHAASHGHVECIARLLAGKADVNLTAGAGRLSSFHAACMGAQRDAALELLHARADAAARGGEHIAMTGLEMAKSRSPDDPTAVAVSRLLRRWAREEADDQLLCAAGLGDLPTLEQMLWTGAWRTLEGGLHHLHDTRLSHGAICAAYLAAACGCHSHCLPLLLTALGQSIERQPQPPSRAVDARDFTPQGWSIHYPLDPALQAASPTKKQVSGRVRVGVDILDSDGRTALMLAVGGGPPEEDERGAERRVQCVEWLLEAGAEVNPARDASGRTAMHTACITGHASAAWVLLRAGAYYDALLDGQDCVALASAAGHRNMAADLSCQGWRVGGGAAGELELGGTDDDGNSVASTQPSVAADDEETDESKLLLLDRAKSEPLYSWITASFSDDGGRKDASSSNSTAERPTAVESAGPPSFDDSSGGAGGGAGEGGGRSDLSWSTVIPRPASARASAGAPSLAKSLRARAAMEAYRYGSLPRDGKLAQQLAPHAAAATPALTAAERAMWEVQLQLDAVQKKSMERMRGPPPLSLVNPDRPDELIAPAFRLKQQHDDARSRSSLASWFDLHERTDMLSRSINTTIDKRFGLGDFAESETASSVHDSEGG